MVKIEEKREFAKGILYVTLGIAERNSSLVLIDKDIIYACSYNGSILYKIPILEQAMIDNNTIGFRYSDSYDPDRYGDMQSEAIFKYIGEKMMRLSQYNLMTACITEVENYPYFVNEFSNIKAAEGVKFFRLNKGESDYTYMIPFLTGIPKINRGDSFNIKVFEYPYANINTAVVTFEIYKKKVKRIITMSMKILKV